MANSQAKGAALSQQMYDAYHDAARDIQSAMNDFFFRYADEQGITYDQARQVLSQPELRVWKKSLADYQLAITQAKTERTRMKLQAELDARAYASRIDRLDALNGQIEIITGRLAMEAEGRLQETLTDVYRDGYHKAWYELQQRIGYIFPVAGVNPRQIETVLAYPWSGNNFSGIIWQNRDLLTNQLRQTITQGLIQGRGINEMTNEVVNRMGVGFRQAHRVVITETAHIQNVADREVYREAGVEWLEFVATLDEATCPICGALDGTKIKLEDAVEGENVPVMHPNCACTTILHDPEEAQDWAAIGEPMPQRMTYDEWAKQNIPQSPAPSGQVNANAPSNGTPITEQDLPWLSSSITDAAMRQGILARVNNMNPNEQALLLDYGAVSFATTTASSRLGAFYSPSNQKITFNAADDAANPRGYWSTIMHEMGHMIDNSVAQSSSSGWLSVTGSDFRDALLLGARRYEDDLKKANPNLSVLDLRPLAKTELSGALMSSVSDLMGGATNNRYIGSYGHWKISYWRNPNALPQEAFAHFFEAASNPARRALLDQYFPEAGKIYDDIIEQEMKKRGLNP